MTKEYQELKPVIRTVVAFLLYFKVSEFRMSYGMADEFLKQLETDLEKAKAERKNQK